MAEVEIVQPRPSYEVVSETDGPWILPQAWKTPARAEMGQRLWNRRFPHLLGRASPAHRLHGPNDNSPSKMKPDKMTTRTNAEMKGGCRASVATLR
jgi:hypothetical protein